jgi:hypothetical protein
MGLLARVFPSWFPPVGDDATSARVLWLDVMATLQVAIGLGYIVQASLFPFVLRLVSAARTADTGTLAMPKVRGVVGR